MNERSLFVYKEFIVSFNNSVYKKTKNIKNMNLSSNSQFQDPEGSLEGVLVLNMLLRIGAFIAYADLVV